MPPLTLPHRVPLARLPTPIAPLERLSREVGGPALWLKQDDLTGSALSGNKVRKLEFSIGEALERGADTLITCGGLQSNHCRATVIAGAQLGLRVHVVLRDLPEGVADGNLFLNELAGAEITCLPAEEFRAQDAAGFTDLVAQHRGEGHTAHVIPMGASDATGIWGYITASEELAADFRRLGWRPDHIVCASGSGGTQAGLIIGNALFDLGTQIWGINVCDDEDYFVTKIRADMRAWKEKYGQSLDVDALPINILDGHIGPGYALSTPEICATIARVARTEGVIFDPVYTGKAFHGLLTEIERKKKKKGETVVFIRTGGIYGLLAQCGDFQL